MSIDQTTTIPQSTTVTPLIPGPRRPFPAAPTRRPPLGRDIDYNRGAYDEAYDRLQRRDRIGQPAAWGAFGDDLPRGAA